MDGHAVDIDAELWTGAPVPGSASDAGGWDDSPDSGHRRLRVSIPLTELPAETSLHTWILRNASTWTRASDARSRAGTATWPRLSSGSSARAESWSPMSAGHGFSDAARALMLHQAFHTAALYEMDLNGQITTRLFEQVNTRFCKSSTLRNLIADGDAASFITLIYGEICIRARSASSARAPSPSSFRREFDRFVEISQDRLVSYPPIGIQPGEDHADAGRYQRTFGYKSATRSTT